MKQFKIGLITSLLILNGCVAYHHKAVPTPLANFQPEVKVKRLWSVNTGEGIGEGQSRLTIAKDDHRLFTADHIGHISAIDQSTGQLVWQRDLKEGITSGPKAGHDRLLLGTETSRLVALSSRNGRVLWSRQLSNELIAEPGVSRDAVFAKTVDGKMTTLALATGKTLWTHKAEIPSLTLRSDSSPQTAGKLVIAGFSNGSLVAFNELTGKVSWKKMIAVPHGFIPNEQLLDINTNPLIVGNTIYVGNYQGYLAALDLKSGTIKWDRQMASQTGITAKTRQVYLTDADSYLWALDRKTGSVSWRQEKLKSRQLTSPTIIGRAVVVADGQGYLHWMDRKDGHFIARTRVDNFPITSSPIVTNNMVYVITDRGQLSAYKVIN